MLQHQTTHPLIRSETAARPAFSPLVRLLIAILLSLALTVLLALAGAAIASADIPDARRCIADSALVASPGGGFAYAVELRDNANMPVPYGTVVLDFTTALGIELCGDQDPDGDRRILGTTNVIGRITFWIKAGGTTSGYVTVATVADAIVLARPRTTDLDGDLDVDPLDVSAISALVGGAGPTGDLDANGTVNAADVAALVAHLGNNCLVTPARSHTWGSLKSLYH